MAAASAALGISILILRHAKKKGCPAFRSNRVHVAELQDWLAKNPSGDSAGEDIDAAQKLKVEQARHWELRNNRAEAQLIARAWVIERFQRAGGELHTLRAKSEAEHPLAFSAACPGSDVASCRSILRGIWSDVFNLIEGMGKHFEEAPGVTTRLPAKKPPAKKKPAKK